MALKLGIVTKQGKPNKALLELLNACNIKHDGTLTDIVDKTQKAWLRPKGKEIWQAPKKRFLNQKKIYQCLIKLGCFKRVMPNRKSYDRVLIFGGVFERMLERFVFAWKLLKANKIQTKQLVFLVGERALDPDLENDKLLLHQMSNYSGSIFDKRISADWLPCNETDFPEYILSCLKVPAHLKKLNTVIIRTPAGSFGRPQTAHTVAQWLQEYELKPRTCTFVSSSPYIGYQDAVVRRVLAQKERSMGFETIGPADKDATITACLDTLARWLYEELEIVKITRKSAVSPLLFTGLVCTKAYRACSNQQYQLN